LHVGETESADQPLGDAIPLDDSQRFIRGRDFAAVGEFETAEPYVRVDALQMQVGLLDEYTGGVLIVLIRGVVACAQAELPQRRGLNRMIRYPQQNWGGQFNAPVIPWFVLAQHETQQRAGVSVVVFAFRVKEIPIFVTLVNRSRDCD